MRHVMPASEDQEKKSTGKSCESMVVAVTGIILLSTVSRRGEGAGVFVISAWLLVREEGGACGGGADAYDGGVGSSLFWRC
jgi:hypothetical protein